MKIEKYLKEVLSCEEIISKTKDKKVYYIQAKNASEPYVEYRIINDPSSYHDENEERNINYTVQVDVFSKGDFIEIKDTIIQKMIDSGFDRMPGADLYEEDTELYHKALRFNVESFIFEDL